VHFLPLYSTLFQSAEGKGIFVFLSCVGSFIRAAFAHSLSLSLSLSLSTWLFDTGKGTTHTLEDHIFGSKIWANWI